MRLSAFVIFSTLAGCSPPTDAPRGWVFATHPDAGPAVETPLPELEHPTLENGRWSVRTCDAPGCRTATARAHAEADGNFRIEPEPEADDDPAAEVNAWAHVAWILEEIANEPGYIDLPSLHAGIDVRIDFEPDDDDDGLAEIAPPFRIDTSTTPSRLYLGRLFGRRAAYDPDILGIALRRLAFSPLPSARLGAHGSDTTAARMVLASAAVLTASATADPGLGNYLAKPLGRTAWIQVNADVACPKDFLGDPARDAAIDRRVLWSLRAALGAEAWATAVYRLANAPPAIFSEVPDALADAMQLNDGDPRLADALDAVTYANCGPTAPQSRHTMATWVPGAAVALVSTSGESVGGPRPAARQLRIQATEGTWAFRVRTVAGSQIQPANLQIHLSVGEPVRFAWNDSEQRILITAEHTAPLSDSDVRIALPNEFHSLPTPIYATVSSNDPNSGFLWLSAALEYTAVAPVGPVQSPGESSR